MGTFMIRTLPPPGGFGFLSGWDVFGFGFFWGRSVSALRRGVRGDGAFVGWYFWRKRFAGSQRGGQIGKKKIAAVLVAGPDWCRRSGAVGGGGGEGRREAEGERGTRLAAELGAFVRVGLSGDRWRISRCSPVGAGNGLGGTRCKRGGCWQSAHGGSRRAAGLRPMSRGFAGKCRASAGGGVRPGAAMRNRGRPSEDGSGLWGSSETRQMGASLHQGTK